MRVILISVTTAFIVGCGGGGGDDNVKAPDLSNLDFSCISPGTPDRTTEYKSGTYTSTTRWYESKKLACTTTCNAGECSTSSYKY